MPAHLDPDPSRPASIVTLPLPFWTDKAGIAHALQRSQRTVDLWRERGILPYIRIGGTIRFNVEECRAAIEQRFTVHQAGKLSKNPRRTKKAREVFAKIRKARRAA